MDNLFTAAFAGLLALSAPSAYVQAVAVKSPRVTHTANATAGIQWGPCDPSIVADPSLVCGLFEIPLDYQDPSAGKGQLAVVKANATGERLGTVFMNPGGPGGSGLEEMGNGGSLLVALTGGNYDIVSWDPRGVGKLSIPGEVYCFDSVEEYDSLFAGTIEKFGIPMYGNFTDKADIARLLDQADTMQEKYEQTGKGCLDGSSSEYLKYVGTAATARDLLALVDVLDGPGAPVNYIGYSYGTLLGAWFLNMFPERVGKVVLDGVLDPTIFASVELATGWPGQLSDSDRVYEGFVTGCALAGPEQCAIAEEGDTPAKLHAKIQDLLKLAHDSELKDPSFTVHSGALRTALYNIMYFPVQWQNTTNEVLPPIFQAILSGAQSNGSDTSKRDIELPHHIVRRAENETQSFSTSAIICGDSKVNESPRSTLNTTFESIINGTQKISHMFGAQFPNPVYYCIAWPSRSVERYEGPFNKTLSNKILVIGNTYDPVTPFKGAKAVADLFGEQAALVRLNALGHTSTAGSSACINEVINAYFSNGTVPEGDDTVCQVDDSYEIWPGVNSKMIFGNMTVNGLQY